MVRALELGENNQLIVRYSLVARRNSPKMLRFTHLPDAVKLCDELRNYGAKGHERLMILKAPRFEHRCWECGGWINTSIPGRETGHRRNCPLVSD